MDWLDALIGLGLLIVFSATAVVAGTDSRIGIGDSRDEIQRWWW